MEPKKMIKKARKYVYLAAGIFWAITVLAYIIGTTGRGNVGLLAVYIVTLPIAIIMLFVVFTMALINFIMKYPVK